MYSGRMPERVSTPSMLATYVNITIWIMKEKQTEQSKASKNKQSINDVPSHIVHASTQTMLKN